jgi:cyanophycinase
MGKIILIGGNVDKGTPLSAEERKEFGRQRTIKMVKLEILDRLVKEMKGKNSRIEIVTSASGIPIAIGNEYKKAFAKLNCKNIGVMHFRTSKAADLPFALERLNKCDGVLFTGGNQSLLCKIILGTKFLALLKERFEKEKKFLIAGTSAGAMALTQIMITKEISAAPFEKGHIKIAKGLNILTRIIVDTHFTQRRRLSRLIEAVAMFPDKLGVGLGEDTAVFFKTPEKVEIIGRSLVILIDGTRISYNNINKIKKKQNICLQDVKLHVLTRGYDFSITRRKIFKKSTIKNL